MSLLLEKVKVNSRKNPSRIFYKNPYLSDNGKLEYVLLTWEDLHNYSDHLGGYLEQNLTTKKPIVVIGHKNQFMPISFLGCVKSGRAYVPVDISYPEKRIRDIIDIVDPEVIITTEVLPFEIMDRSILTHNKIQDIVTSSVGGIGEDSWVRDEDLFYIIFTSGSTGKPKGVQITSACLDNFVRWARTISDRDIDDGNLHTFINHAPFSFDLSVFDLYLALYTGGTLCAMPGFVQSDLSLYLKCLIDFKADVWVSTPSSMEIALSINQFNQDLLPYLNLFLFCGETLTVQTAEKLNKVFPNAKVVNTYGPTKSTVAVTSIVITDEIRAQYNPLPIGYVKPESSVYIIDENGNVVSGSERGEIVIVGNTVSPGYWHNCSKTEEVFGTIEVDGNQYRSYHTHDKGYYENGLLFYCGRIDLQIKLHGFRIELEDIESNLLKVENIERAVVLPNQKEGKIVSLTAYIVLKEIVQNHLAERKRIRESLKAVIPEYMIPKNYIFLDSLPVTINGKVDRNKLEARRNVQS